MRITQECIVDFIYGADVQTRTSNADFAAYYLAEARRLFKLEQLGLPGRKTSAQMLLQVVYFRQQMKLEAIRGQSIGADLPARINIPRKAA